MKSYSEKLRDPRWQKKRLEIYERDNFQCQMCFDTESTLVAHHKEYIKGREPWEYDDEIITLCEDCHQSIHYWIEAEKKEPERFNLEFYGFNMTDWRILHERFSQLKEREGGIYSGKTILQLITSYVVKANEM